MTKDDWWKKLIDLEIWWIKEVDLIYRFLGFWWWTYEQRDRLKIFCHFNVYPKIAWKIRNFCLISNSTIMQKCKNECWHQQHQDASIHSLHLLLQRHLLVLSRYYYGNMSVSSRILRSPGLFGCVLSNPAHDTTGHRSETLLNLICYCISLYFICHLELHQKVPENIKC